jgi:hypothetical protein
MVSTVVLEMQEGIIWPLEAARLFYDDLDFTLQQEKVYARPGNDLDTIVREDNNSSILLMKNGRLSSGKGTKHLDIRYF